VKGPGDARDRLGQGAGKKIARFGKDMESVGRSMTMGLSAPLAAVGAWRPVLRAAREGLINFVYNIAEEPGILLSLVSPVGSTIKFGISQ
jgi:hypothetical protein